MNKILHACGLASNPRWIDLSNEKFPNHFMCSNCGETFNGIKPPQICPHCKNEMDRINELSNPMRDGSWIYSGENLTNG